MNLLLRDYRTLIKTLIKRLQHSYQEITVLISRDYKTPIRTLIKRLQHSYKFPINSYESLIDLLSRDYRTPIKRLHNKMLEYLNFCLLCAIFTLILYLYIRTKKYFPILKMAEELIGNLGYGTLNQTQSVKNYSNAFSLEIASCIWERFTQKKILKNLMKKKWKNFLIITKLNSRVRW